MADIVKLIYKGDEMAQGGGSGSAPQATTSVIGTVRGATAQEVDQHAETGSQGELLVMTPLQIHNYYAKGPGYLRLTKLNVSNTATGADARAEISYSFPNDGFAVIEWNEEFNNGDTLNRFEQRDEQYYMSVGFTDLGISGISGTINHRELIAVPSGTRNFSVFNTGATTSTIKLVAFFYFEA